MGKAQVILLSKKGVLEDKAVEREVELEAVDEEEVNTTGPVCIGVGVEVKVEVRFKRVVKLDTNLMTAISSGLRQLLMFM